MWNSALMIQLGLRWEKQIRKLHLGVVRYALWCRLWLCWHRRGCHDALNEDCYRGIDTASPPARVPNSLISR